MNNAILAQDSLTTAQTQRATSGLPLLSVIIPTKNRAKYIERCLLSIFSEIENDYPNTEVIIIDGGSTDGTVDILRKYDNKITYWISEPDSGVSEAVNKGLARVRGEFVRLLGDEDELIPSCFSKMISYVMAHPDVDILIGHSAWYLEDDFGNRTPLNYKQPVGWMNFLDMVKFWRDRGSITPEAAVFRTKLFHNYGGYDTKFHLFAYWELWLRQTKHGATIYVVPDVIMNRIQTSVSDGQKYLNTSRWNREVDRVLWKHTNLYWVLWHRFGGGVGMGWLFWYVVRTVQTGGKTSSRRMRNLLAKLKRPIKFNTTR